MKEADEKIYSLSCTTISISLQFTFLTALFKYTAKADGTMFLIGFFLPEEVVQVCAMINMSDLAVPHQYLVCEFLHYSYFLNY